jgi:copper ion binding protein
MSETGGRTFSVSGMTCAHCVAAVSESVGALPGIEAVSVDLEAGAVTIHGSDVREDAVRGALESAGYALAGPA